MFRSVNTETRRFGVRTAALLVAALLGSSASASQIAAESGAITLSSPPDRSVLFVGGRTLAAWQAAGSPLFAEPGAHVFIAPDGNSSSMLLGLQKAISAANPAIVHVLPDPLDAAADVASTKDHLTAMVSVAREAGARVVLARPIALGTPEAESSGDLAEWMRAFALERGLMYADYQTLPLGQRAPVKSATDLPVRDAAVRTALDNVFNVEPGATWTEVFRRRAVEQSAMPDTSGTGPYPAVRTTDPALPNTTVYRPSNLQPFTKARMPVVIWGNGGCADDGSNARPTLSEIASHGFFVIALGSPKSGPGGIRREPTTQSRAASQMTIADMQSVIDTIVSGTATREWRKYVDVKKLAAAGWSCGGLQALGVSADPRVASTLVVHSGAFADATQGISGISVDKRQVAKLHAPVLYLHGGPSDVAYPNALDDFSRVAKAPAVMVGSGYGHAGTLLESNGGPEAQVIRAWLQWQLRGDVAQRSVFIGDKCGICSVQGWTVTSKGW